MEQGSKEIANGLVHFLFQIVSMDSGYHLDLGVLRNSQGALPLQGENKNYHCHWLQVFGSADWNKYGCDGQCIHAIQ